MGLDLVGYNFLCRNMRVISNCFVAIATAAVNVDDFTCKIILAPFILANSKKTLSYTAYYANLTWYSADIRAL